MDPYSGSQAWATSSNLPTELSLSPHVIKFNISMFLNFLADVNRRIFYKLIVRLEIGLEAMAVSTHIWDFSPTPSPQVNRVRAWCALVIPEIGRRQAYQWVLLASQSSPNHPTAGQWETLSQQIRLTASKACYPRLSFRLCYTHACTNMNTCTNIPVLKNIHIRKAKDKSDGKKS